MTKYCECGCGQVVKNRYVRGHHTKNKTYSEIYGDKKSKQLIKNLKTFNKHKTYEDIHGDEKAKIIKQKQSIKHKGLYKEENYEERFGKERAKNIKLSQRKIKNINQIIDVLKDTTKNKNITKMEFFNDITVKTKLGTMNTIRDTLKKEGLTLDAITKLADIQFKRNNNRIGINEKEILDNIEKEQHIKINRQIPILNFYVDGYDSTNNIIYEVDEKHHKRTRIQDTIRENKIKKVLNCNIIRIKDNW